MKKIILFLFFLLLFYSSSFAQQEDTLSIQTEKTTCVFRKSPFSNLVYQITCLADLGYGTRTAYTKLWKEKLNWSQEDSIKIEEWKSIIEKNDTILFKKNDSSQLNTTYPFNFPDQTYLSEKIILEGIKANSIEEYKKNMKPLLSSEEINKMESTLLHFSDRFYTWWNSLDQDSIVFNYYTLFKEKKLDLFCEKVAHFYGSIIPPNHRIYFNMMILPLTDEEKKTSKYKTSGNQIENYSLIEVGKNEPAQRQMEVVIHELFHYFHELSSTKKQLETICHFANSKSPYAWGFYSYLNEVLATVLGNGIVGQKVSSKEKFEERFKKEQSWYANYYIDQSAKAIFDYTKTYIEKNKTLDESFCKEYIKLGSKKMKENIHSLSFILSSHGFIVSDDTLYTLTPTLRRNFRTICIDYGNLKDKITPLEKYKKLSSVILVLQKDISLLKNKESILGTSSIETIEKNVKNYSSFVYPIARSKKCTLYVLVAKDLQSMENLLTKFAKLKREQCETICLTEPN